MKESNRENNPELDVGRALDNLRQQYSAPGTAHRRAQVEEQARTAGATFAEVERTKNEGEAVARASQPPQVPQHRKLPSPPPYGAFRGR